MRLPARHHIRAEYVAAEFVCEIEDRETELQAIDRTGRRDASGYVGARLNELAGPAYLREVGTKSIKNRELEIVRETPRQRLAYRRLDRRNGIVPSSPGVVFKCVLEICCVTKISDEFRQDGVSQRLAVSNHAVKIENQCTQFEAQREYGPCYNASESFPSMG